MAHQKPAPAPKKEEPELELEIDEKKLEESVRKIVRTPPHPMKPKKKGD